MTNNKQNIQKQPDAKTGYKLTKLGWIPEDWEIDNIENALIIENNKRKPISEDIRKTMQGEFPYYGPTKIQDYINEYKYDGEYALIAEDGDHFLKYKNMPMTQFVSGKFNVNNHAHAIKGTDTCSTEWFFWFYRNRSIFSHLTRQGAGRYKLNKASLSKLQIATPSLPEQKAIATCLSTWGNAIELQDKKIKLLEKRKKGLMQQLLTGKKRLSGFGGEWKEVKLGDIVDIKKGTQLNKENLDKSGKYPSYSGGIKPSGYTDGWNTEKDTIIISEGGNSCGYVNYIKTNFWSGGHCYSLLNLKDKIQIHFLFQILKQNEPELMRLRVGSGLPNVQKKDIVKFKISTPNLKEQTAIASILQTADKEIELEKVKLEKIKYEKKGLMQQLLTGKKRLGF